MVIQMKKLLVAAFAILLLGIFSQTQAADYALRWGEGGLHDDRAPDKALGGGQLALDIKLDNLPIAISIAGEYYKKGPDAIYPYEIQNLNVIYLLYTTPLTKKWKSNIYGGGGIGVLEVPKSDIESNNSEWGILFDAALGINTRVFRKLGVYVEGKYIYSSKTRNNVKVIDFSDFGLLVGISYNFGW